MIALQWIAIQKCWYIQLSYYIFGESLVLWIRFFNNGFDLLLDACLGRQPVLHTQKKNVHIAKVFAMQLTGLKKLLILTTPESSDINSGYTGVADGWSCIPGWSLEDQSESHFRIPNACLDLGHATVAGHGNSLATACPYPHLCLHPSQDPHVHDDPGT